LSSAIYSVYYKINILYLLITITSCLMNRCATTCCSLPEPQESGRNRLCHRRVSPRNLGPARLLSRVWTNRVIAEVLSEPPPVSGQLSRPPPPQTVPHCGRYIHRYTSAHYMYLFQENIHIHLKILSVPVYSCTRVLMYSCTHVLMYSCTHVHMHSCTHELSYLCTHVLMYLSTHVLMYICTRVLMYSRTYVLMYSRTYALMYSRTYALVYSCTHVLMYLLVEYQYSLNIFIAKLAIITSIFSHVNSLHMMIKVQPFFSI
jgi:hypothetical protein